MNLDTLIEAAKFVELQEVHALGTYTRVDYGTEESSSSPQEDRDGSGPSVLRQRSPPLEKRAYHTSVWAKTSGESPYSRDRDEEFQDLRRRPGAGTREVHNKLEKNRRAHLKECFELVKKQLPSSHEDKKASNLNILHNAIKYIQTLRRKDREYEHEMERLAREKIALQQRFANLKKELSAQWDHIDFNTLIPESAISDHEEVLATSDTDEAAQRRSVGYSSTSSLSSAATASASPHLPHSVSAEDRNSPRSHLSPKHIPSDGQKMISFTSRLEPVKRPLTNSQIKNSTHVQLPVLANSNSGHIAATLVSPTIQLVTSSNLRMMPGDPPLAFSFSSQATPHTTSGVTLMQKAHAEEETLSLVHSNGVRRKGSILTIPNGAFHAGLTAKNGVIYKPPHQASGNNNLIPTHLTSSFTHVVTPLAGSHGTLVTPVPVTVVSQGNQVAHIITAPSGKVVTPLSLKPLVSQYLVKPGAAMVVVSQNSTVSHSGSK